ncbi:MAG: hypothetical protein ACJ0O0_06585 [Flavobacteriaceae bacterium]
MDRVLFLPQTEGFGSLMPKFKKYLKKVRAYSIDMETATLFSVGFHNRIPTGALLLSNRSADDTRRNKNQQRRMTRIQSYMIRII